MLPLPGPWGNVWSVTLRSWHWCRVLVRTGGSCAGSCSVGSPGLPHRPLPAPGGISAGCGEQQPSIHPACEWGRFAGGGDPQNPFLPGVTFVISLEELGVSCMSPGAFETWMEGGVIAAHPSKNLTVGTFIWTQLSWLLRCLSC